MTAKEAAKRFERVRRCTLLRWGKPSSPMTQIALVPHNQAHNQCSPVGYVRKVRKLAAESLERGKKRVRGRGALHAV